MSIKQSRFSASFLIQDLITGMNDIQYNSYLPELMNIPEFEAELRLLASFNLSVLSGDEYKLCSFEFPAWGDENGREEDERYLLVVKSSQNVRLNYHQPLLGTDVFRNVAGGASWKLLLPNGSVNGMLLDSGSLRWLPIDNDGSLYDNFTNNRVGMRFVEGANIYVFQTTSAVPTSLTLTTFDASNAQFIATGRVAYVGKATDVGTSNTQTAIRLVGNSDLTDILAGISVSAPYTSVAFGIYQTSVLETSFAVLDATNLGAVQIFNPNSSSTAVQVGLYKLIDE